MSYPFYRSNFFKQTVSILSLLYRYFSLTKKYTYYTNNNITTYKELVCVSILYYSIKNLMWTATMYSPSPRAA